MCFGGGSARRASDQAAALAAAEQQRQADIERQRLAEEARIAREEAERRYQEERARQDAILAQQRADAEALRRQLQDQEALRLSELQRIEAARRAEREAELARQNQIRTEDLDRQRTQRDQDLARQVAERAAAEAAARDRARQLGEYNTGRQRIIDSARSQIDNAFGVYNDDYFAGVANDYVATQKPKIAQQYDDAKRSTTFDYARRGNLKSTAAARAFGRLDQTRAEAEAEAAQQAQEFANQQRSQITQQRAGALSSIFGAVGAAPVVTAENVSEAGGAALGQLSGILSSAPVQVGVSRASQAPDVKLAFNASAQQAQKPAAPRKNKAADGTPLMSSGGSGRLVA